VAGLIGWWFWTRDYFLVSFLFDWRCSSAVRRSILSEAVPGIILDWEGTQLSQFFMIKPLTVEVG